MFFDKIPEGAPDSIFGMLGTFLADQRPNKINLMVGIFKDENLRAELIPAVKVAKERILSKDLLADYLPFEGVPEFIDLLEALVFGKTNWGSVYGTQCLGGTSALRVGADFLAQEVGRKVYLPQPTWGNHRNIFERAGFQIETIPYYNQAIHSFDAEKYLTALKVLPPKSIVVFHAACHNPTGSDPTFDNWKTISAICKERSLFPFFDFAYQGFGDGVEEDAKVVRYFREQGHEMLVAYSCSKNFSLYCQRVGALFAVCANPGDKHRVGSQIRRITRAMYSNPPAHGARIVVEILRDEKLRAEWLLELEKMRMRLVSAQNGLAEKLIAKSKHFQFLRNRKGMFTYLDLEKNQVQALIDRYGIYTLESGRISVAGLTPANIEIVSEKVLSVCE